MQEQENGEMELKGAVVYGLHAWAMLEQRLGNWSKARELLERAANVQPGNAVVHQTRALLESRAHNYAAARFHFRLAVEAAPEDVKCWQVRWDATEQNIGKWVFRCWCLDSLSSFCLIQNCKLEVDEEQVEVN
jgi:tetratricopeptide (TPR) repeat protein